MKVIALGMMLVCAGCASDSAVVWSGSVKSPSGSMVASARTIQTSGPGNASVITTVTLGYAKGSDQATSVLVVENPSAADHRRLQVDMVWRDDQHLDVTYPNDASLDFRADYFGGITISSHPR
ncbi:hypothetical protein KPL74_09205 [Bacillus sp. NP157]|nr:hypothetical protein KPL74_09205 [Bacillus sp. NP157]